MTKVTDSGWLAGYETACGALGTERVAGSSPKTQATPPGDVGQ